MKQAKSLLTLVDGPTRSANSGSASGSAHISAIIEAVYEKGAESATEDDEDFIDDLPPDALAVFSVELSQDDVVLALAKEIAGKPDATRSHPMKTRGTTKAQVSSTTAEPATSESPSGFEAGSRKHARGYQLKSPAENQELLRSLFNMILNGDLTSVTPSHIFAASPPLRMMVTNYLRKNKIHVQTLGVFVRDDENGRICAPESMPLRQMAVTINDEVTTLGCFDPGSEIVTMREELFKKLSGIQLRPDDAVPMISANDTVLQQSYVPVTRHTASNWDTKKCPVTCHTRIWDTFYMK